ncbi:MAG: hypothetical protein AB1649_31205, partial [Chloroflexota bacterium]
MSEKQTPAYVPANQPRSTGALAWFIILASSIPICSFVYDYITWFLAQNAIASASVGFLAASEAVGLAVQALIISVLTGLLWRFTTDDRFKSVYFGWFIASLIAFPALSLRALGPNNDQIGAIIQFLLCAF